VEIVNKLRNSSTKGIIWMLLVVVFTVKSCDFLIDYYTAFKSYNVENASDETENRDMNEGCFEKNAKKLFSFSEDGLSEAGEAWAAPLSTHWSIYSFSIFKEPLRDVLTPPPLPLNFS
jgi:hypothetical protein